MLPGQKFRKALEEEKPLQIVGAINAYVAIMAKEAGFRSLYLSGAGVANASYGLPDLATTTLDNVLEDTSRITAAVDLPLLVDIDTGWGNNLMIARSVALLGRAGAAGVHIEDQVFDKRCGHRSGKKIVSTEEMQERIKAAINGKPDPSFVIMARSDAFEKEGMPGLIKRALAYRDAGADMFFAEALQTLDQYTMVKKAIGIPVVVNITEFGKTPLFNLQELAKAHVDMALYPLTIARIMNKAAENALKILRKAGTQSELIGSMQTREELYNYLDYVSLEKKIDEEGGFR